MHLKISHVLELFRGQVYSAMRHGSVRACRSAEKTYDAHTVGFTFSRTHMGFPVFHHQMVPLKRAGSEDPLYIEIY